MSKHFYEFGQFRIDAEERVLLRDGAPLTLPPKVFETLLALVERNGHIVDKEELIQQVWPDTFVEENNLSQYISAIRKALGDGRHEQRYIETVPRRGYRFTGQVREIWNEQEELIQVSHTKMSLRIEEESETPDAITVQPGAMPKSSTRRMTIFATAGLLVLVVVFIGASRFRQTNSTPAVASRVRTLAVLPLKSGGDQFFGLSIADQLIAGFDQSLDIDVRSTNSIYRYLATERDAVAAGHDLKVDAVFEGDAQKTGDRIAINLRLFDTRDGKLLWQARHEDDLKNSLAMTNSLVEKAAREVFTVSAGSLKSILAKRATTSAAAHEAYVKGRYYWNNRTAEGLHQSIGLFEQAITSDPNYALAHAGLADAYAFDHIEWPKAEASARKALEMDSALGQAHASIGFVRWFWLWDWAAADREFKLAIALSPDYATAHQWYAGYLASRGYLREAKAEMQRALELEPFSLSINADLAQVLYFLGDFDGAVKQCEQALVLDQNFVNAHLHLYQAYTVKGRYDEAVSEYFKVQEIFGNPRESERGRDLRAAYATTGIRGFWREKLRNDEPDLRRIKDPYLKAEYHALLGEKDQAVNMLAEAFKRREPPMLFAKVNPMFKSLYEHPRFAALMFEIDNWNTRSLATRTSGG